MVKKLMENQLLELPWGGAVLEIEDVVASLNMACMAAVGNHLAANGNPACLVVSLKLKKVVRLKIFSYYLLLSKFLKYILVTIMLQYHNSYIYRNLYHQEKHAEEVILNLGAKLQSVI